MVGKGGREGVGGGDQPLYAMFNTYYSTHSILYLSKKHIPIKRHPRNMCLFPCANGFLGIFTVILSPFPKMYRSRIRERTISLRFPGIILRLLRLEVPVYNVYITNQTTFARVGE